MHDNPVTEHDPVDADSSVEENKPSWWNITVDDLANLDFEQPIGASKAADCNELASLYQAAAYPDRKHEPPDSPKLRTFTFIAAALNMYFKPEERNEPFGPFISWADGRRSAIASDFTQHLEVLAYIATRVSNPAIRARLADLCWILDRKRGAMGHTALTAYVDIVKGADQGGLRFRFQDGSGVWDRDACDHLRRALFLGRALGWNRPETVAARQLVAELRARAAAGGQLLPLLWLSELDLQFGVADNTAELASTMEAAITALPTVENSHLVVDFWRFASRAYFRAQREEDAHRCRHEAAENLVRQADATEASSSLMTATLLSSAIAQLSGSPIQKARRQELRHRLVDVQGRVLDEMSSFSHPIDLSELVERTEKRLEAVSLLEKLFLFALLTRSPEPDELVRKAKETLQNHPLFGLFGASHLDREGKVIHRTKGAGVGSHADDAVQAQIAQAEQVRRHVVVTGQIDVARQLIITQHHVSNDGLHALLQQSPAVPPDLVGTLSHGFTRFFQGDFTGSTYILTPMLEAMLRHILKSAGHDVTTFDDSTETQEDRTISSLFDQMRSELDNILGAALTTDLENVFLKKPGPHLRHALAHGLLHDGSPFGNDAVYGSWLIFRICLLPLVPHRDNIAAPADWLRPTD